MVNHGFFYQVAHITVTIGYIFEQSNCNKNNLLTKNVHDYATTVKILYFYMQYYADFDRFESVDRFFVMIVDICCCLNIK